VAITLTDGSTETYDNNGEGYSVQDTIIYQGSQSCLDPTTNTDGTNTLTVVAAVCAIPIPSTIIFGQFIPFSVHDRSRVITNMSQVRSNSTSSPSLDLTLPVPRVGSVIPALALSSVSMTQGDSVGPYTLYQATFSIDEATSTPFKFDVSVVSGDDKVADEFKSSTDLGSTCVAL
jgi:hypothetical protein